MQYRGLGKLGVLTSLVMLSLLLAACGEQSTPTNPALQVINGTYFGPVSGSQAFVAIISETTRALIYVTDGKTINEWFDGEKNGNKFTLTSSGRANLQVELYASFATGLLSLPDTKQYPFIANLVSGEAGLYRLDEVVNGVKFITGWIILADGQQRAGRTNGSLIFPAPPLKPEQKKVTDLSAVPTPTSAPKS